MTNERQAGLWRLAALVLLLGGLVAASRLPAARGAVEGLNGKVEALAPLIFVGAYAVATVAMVPGSALTLAAGAAFGPVLGALVASTGATVGAAGAFLIARHLARDAVTRVAERSPRWRALDGAIRTGGWKVVALLRLSPAVPFNVQNYLYGLTGLRFWPCVLTSWWAMLPGAFLYASLGTAGRVGLSAASGGGKARGPAEWALLGLGLAATVAVTWRVGRLARQALEKEDALERSAP